MEWGLKMEKNRRDKKANDKRHDDDDDDDGNNVEADCQVNISSMYVCNATL